MSRVRVLVGILWMLVRGSVSEAATVGPSAGDVEEATKYFAKYGYLEPGRLVSGRSSSLLSLTDSIRKFQQFAQLKITGKLDEATMRKLRLPRCGVMDISAANFPTRRRKRYVLEGSRWKTPNLKYKIVSWPSSVSSRSEVREEIGQAFKVWQENSALTFKQVDQDEDAHIEIRFVAGDHGDGSPFDGRGGTLAHAFFPRFGGQAHFDDDELFEMTHNGEGSSLFMTASHEFGHSLGLLHSKQAGSLMSPFYQAPPADGSRNVLTHDDIAAIQRLYGPPENQEQTPPPLVPTLPPGETDAHGDDGILCGDGAISIDAMFTIGSQKQTYVFRRDLYWKLTEDGIAKDYPKKIQANWPGVPDNIDAAFVWAPKNRIYFFKGRQYWRMTNFKMDDEYPMLISDGFKGIPNNLDASFVWRGNGRVYFFKGSQYWRYDSGQTRPVSHKYPQPVSNWRGIPDNLDTVFTYRNGYSYFFKNGQYYRFDDDNFRVDTSHVPYPRPVGQWWFNCLHQSRLRDGPHRTIGHGPVMEFSDFSRDANNGGSSGLRENWSLAATCAVSIILIIIH